jgi:3-hydroxyisobutyrate dehydrogenase
MRARQIERVAFLGLGAMGRPMAETLLGAGFLVTVFDIRAESRAALVARGAREATSAAEAVADTAACVIMVQNFAQVRAIMWGEGGAAGALDALPAGALVLLMSSVAPADARELDAACRERGVFLLDAPVSGGTGAAASGTLSIIVGGPAETLARAVPLLDALGDPVRRWQVGPNAGDGQAMKMINQLMAGINIAASCEALVLAAKAGLDPQQAYEIIRVSAGGSWMFDNRVPRMLDREFTPPHSALAIFVKDLGIVTDTADDLGLPLFLAPLARQIFKYAAASGLAAEDDSGLIRFYEAAAGLHLGPHDEA